MPYSSRGLLLDAKGSAHRGRANRAGLQRLSAETALQPASHRHSLSAAILLDPPSPSVPELSQPWLRAGTQFEARKEKNVKGRQNTLLLWKSTTCSFFLKYLFKMAKWAKASFTKCKKVFGLLP